MAAEIQTLPDGTEALVITSGPNIEIHALNVIASYSELLGEPDPAKTVLLIREAMKIKDQRGMWGPVYKALHDGLGELVNAGVPPEFMPDLLEAQTGSPVPGPGKAATMRAAQKAVRDRVSGGGQNTAEFAALLRGRQHKVKEARAAFLGKIAPRRKEPAPVVAAPSPFIKETWQATDIPHWGIR
jgi:hypothetical protein